MKILVTGSHGQVGSELIKQGRRLGFEMLAFTRQELDISCCDSVQRILKKVGPDIVLNAAAYTSVDLAETNKELAYLVNSLGPKHLATECKKYDIPLFHISTDFVYSGNKLGSWSENNSTDPLNTYGASKLEGDDFIQQISEKFIILRVSWVFSNTGNNFVSTILRLAKVNKELKIIDDQTGGPTWAGDIAFVLLHLVNQYKVKNKIQWGIYNYSGCPPVTWYEFANYICKFGFDTNLLSEIPTIKAITTEEYKLPANRPKNSVLNCQKIKRIYTIEQPDWRTSLKAVIKNWTEINA